MTSKFRRRLLDSQGRGASDLPVAGIGVSSPAFADSSSVGAWDRSGSPSLERGRLGRIV